MNLNIFKKKKEKGTEKGSISLTFKMSLINFLNYFTSHHNWEVQFNDDELSKLEEAIKKVKKGKLQELIFEDEIKIKQN
ncbi:hypothetical protein LCGC14_1555590 [marine sediment metagenome]|uniref:Uncharacterized protein n=1 Tax=marine sediment metagenome TaxID=412755 RepID=A0A0F9JA06_9ZZZZ